VSALPTDAFVFEGFLPRKSGDRREKLRSLTSERRTIILYEAPHRLAGALADIEEVLGDRRLAVCREMTKLHEEIFRGTVTEARRHFSSPRGEVVLVIAGNAGTAEIVTDEQIAALIQAGLAARKSPSRLAAEISAVANLPRRRVYELILDMGN
jgi:16S rRNA (cytidine1402-2'-O)-methyltransferase